MSKPTILIVEDEVIVAADLENKLRRLGYAVVGAERSALTAVDTAKRERPDLVLMDIRLAGPMDGIDAAILMRRNLSVPVVFLTAHSDATTLERAGHAEAFGYILKPFHERELHTHIQMALYKHATEQRLREADRRKTEFIALLSHELRNPLAAIRNSANVLGSAPQDSERAKKSRAIIDRQVNQLVRLVDDLLDVTRITQNKLHLVRSRFDLVELVRKTLDDHRAFLDEHDVRLATSFAHRPVNISGDSARIAQVVDNLLHNAAKFTPSGGTVTVTVTVAVNRNSEQAEVRVHDTGMGIEPNLLEALFQPFVQADRTLAHGQGGLGLGLSVVHGIVTLHGGTVHAASAGSGKGAEFIITLPLDDGPLAEPLVSSPRQPTLRRRVLIVEDNRDVAEALRQSLELEGHEVHVAFLASDGVNLARELQPEIVLCDIGLPGMDGYEVARTLRLDPALRSIYLVAISGYAQPKDVAEAHAAGFNEHLAKPVHPSRLREILTRSMAS